jgi:hypothetical protein
MDRASEVHRRALLRTAPVVLATVFGRSILAQETATISGCASIAPSGWLARHPDVTPGACAAVGTSAAPYGEQEVKLE